MTHKPVGFNNRYKIRKPVHYYKNLLLYVVGVTSDKTRPSNPLVFKTSETEMIKSFFKNNTLSGNMSLINNNIFVDGFFFFKREIEANVPKN